MGGYCQITVVKILKYIISRLGWVGWGVGGGGMFDYTTAFCINILLVLLHSIGLCLYKFV